MGARRAAAGVVRAPDLPDLVFWPLFAGSGCGALFVFLVGLLKIARFLLAQLVTL